MGYQIQQQYQGQWEPIPEGEFQDLAAAESAFGELHTKLGWTDLRIVETETDGATLRTVVGEAPLSPPAVTGRYRTVTLTGRPPVRISEDAWPVIASARDFEGFGAACEAQADRYRIAWIVVRRHRDGRALVYGGCRWRSHWRGEGSWQVRRGLYLSPGGDLVAAVERVAGQIAAGADREDPPYCEDGESSEYARLLARLAEQTIEGLPAERL